MDLKKQTSECSPWGDLQDRCPIHTMEDFSLSVAYDVRKNAQDLADEAFVWLALFLQALTVALIRLQCHQGIEFLDRCIALLKEKLWGHHVGETRAQIAGAEFVLPTTDELSKAFSLMIRRARSVGLPDDVTLCLYTGWLAAREAAESYLSEEQVTAFFDTLSELAPDYFLPFEDTARKRFEELQRTAAVRGLLGQLILQ